MNNPASPTHFGRYEVLRPLGEGGMAQVYCAHDPMLERQVAVKVVGHELLGDASFAERFRREARAIAALRHAHIVQVYDFGEEDGAYYMVMEYVEGHNLAERMAALRQEGQRMPQAETLDIIDQVADALDYAHAHGVVHRDVKPANVLLRGDNPRDAVLADFGIALMLDRSTEATQGKSFGTPEYIAPEQAVHSSDATARSDIYSLGVMAYALLTGELPFVGDSALNLALQHVNSPPRSMQELVPDISPAVESAVLRALEKDPALRYGSAGELASTLRHAVAAPAQADAPTTPFTQPQPPLVWPAAAATAGEPVTMTPRAVEPHTAARPAPRRMAPRPRRRDSRGRSGPSMWSWMLIAPVIALCVVAALVAALLLNSGVLARLGSFSFSPPGTPQASPTADAVQGAGGPIRDAKLAGQQFVKIDGKKKFVSQLTFTIAATTYDGLWAEFNGGRYSPVSCQNGTCTFEVAAECSTPAVQRMTFHSGVYYRYTTFTLDKPPGCKG